MVLHVLYLQANRDFEQKPYITRARNNIFKVVLNIFFQTSTRFFRTQPDFRPQDPPVALNLKTTVHGLPHLNLQRWVQAYPTCQQLTYGI